MNNKNYKKYGICVKTQKPSKEHQRRDLKSLLQVDIPEHAYKIQEQIVQKCTFSRYFRQSIREQNYTESLRDPHCHRSRARLGRRETILWRDRHLRHRPADDRVLDGRATTRKPVPRVNQAAEMLARSLTLLLALALDVSALVEGRRIEHGSRQRPVKPRARRERPTNVTTYLVNSL